jgi:hypothetical protein
MGGGCNIGWVVDEFFGVWVLKMTTKPGRELSL